MGIEILITVGLILILSLAIIAAVCLKVLFSMMKYNNQLHDRLMARSLAEYANKQLVDKLADARREQRHLAGVQPDGRVSV